MLTDWDEEAYLASTTSHEASYFCPLYCESMTESAAFWGVGDETLHLQTATFRTCRLLHPQPESTASNLQQELASDMGRMREFQAGLRVFEMH